MAWADRQVLARLRTAPGDEAALKWYAHVLGAERVWLLRLQGQDWTTQRVWPALGLDECAELAEQNAVQYAQYAARLSDADLSREVRYSNSAGDSFASTVATSWPRWSCTAPTTAGRSRRPLRAQGAEAPVLDYIRFARGK